jgi:hypothetical protein
MASFAQIVKPMQHGTKGRMSLLLWNFPIPRGDDLVRLRENGSLRRSVDQMAERGFVPTVEMGWQWTLPGALAMARTLQEAGQPVYLMIPRVDFLEGTAYEGCTVWGTGPDATRGGQVRRWPCLALARPELTARWLRDQLQPFQEAKIRVQAVWLDDECLPHPWNGCYEAQRASEACRRAYPPGVLDRFDAFRAWADNFRADLFSKGTSPVKQMFPGALVGEYGDVVSGADARFSLDALMPSAYANTVDLPGAFRGRSLEKAAVDRFYFRNLLAIVSSANAGKARGKLSIPYLSQWTPDNQDPKYRDFAMTQGLYRELNRHLWLRGCDSLYLFNLGYPGSGVPAKFSLQSVEDVRAVYDEMLAWREYLERGKPMNYAVAKSLEDEAVWSGLELDGRSLVRTVSLGQADRKVEVRRANGKAVLLDAPRGGATYLIDRNDRTERIAAPNRAALGSAEE